MEYILSIGIFQALVAAVLLGKSKLRGTADGLLILLLVCIATHLSIKLIIYTCVSDSDVRYMLNTFINFAYGPLLYLYSKKVAKPDHYTLSEWFLFVPLILGAIGFFSVVSVIVAAAPAGHKMLDWYNTISFWTFIPANSAFALMSLRLVKHLPVTSRERRLVRQISFSFVSLAVMGIVFYCLMASGNQMNTLSRCIAYSLLIGVSLLILRYRYFSPAPVINLVELADSVEKEKLQGPTPESTIDTAWPEEDIDEGMVITRKAVQLSDEEMESTWQLLEKAMSSIKVYADCDLSLDRLAEVTGRSKYHISETLNRYGGKTFYQYVNEYRIQHVTSRLQQLLSKGINVNILTLAFDAGFNSKSSFNRYFKEITGSTPTDFSKQWKLSGV